MVSTEWILFDVYVRGTIDCVSGRYRGPRLSGRQGRVEFAGADGLQRPGTSVGFAYDVLGSGKFVLRGGFGMFFDAVNANVVGVGEPFYYQINAQLPPGGASRPLLAAWPRIIRAPLVLPNGFDKANPQFQAPYSLFYPDRNFRTPYYEAMNMGFEYRVTRGGMLDMNYVGKLGRKLTIPFDQNPAILIAVAATSRPIR